MDKNLRERTIVRRATKSDLKDVAKIHKLQFKTHYLGNFSERLLYHFYESLLCQDLIFIVSETDGCVSGFVVGGSLSKINECTSSFIRQNISIYFFEILFRPRTWKKSCEKLLNIIFRKVPPKQSLDCVMEYTLLSIAVSPTVQGHNIASFLISQFDKLMGQFSSCYFLSVKKDNLRALRFYHKNGFMEKVFLNDEVQLTKEVGK
jgi:ribosomal protein S18 acetylase RimI-like enzyme